MRKRRSRADSYWANGLSPVSRNNAGKLHVCTRTLYKCLIVHSCENAPGLHERHRGVMERIAAVRTWCGVCGARSSASRMHARARDCFDAGVYGAAMRTKNAQAHRAHGRTYRRCKARALTLALCALRARQFFYAHTPRRLAHNTLPMNSMRPQQGAYQAPPASGSNNANMQRRPEQMIEFLDHFRTEYENLVSENKGYHGLRDEYNRKIEEHVRRILYCVRACVPTSADAM